MTSSRLCGPKLRHTPTRVHTRHYCHRLMRLSTLLANFNAESLGIYRISCPVMIMENRGKNSIADEKDRRGAL